MVSINKISTWHLQKFCWRIVLDPDHNIEVHANAVFNVSLTSAFRMYFTAVQKDMFAFFKENLKPSVTAVQKDTIGIFKEEYSWHLAWIWWLSLIWESVSLHVQFCHLTSDREPGQLTTAKGKIPWKLTPHSIIAASCLWWHCWLTHDCCDRPQLSHPCPYLNPEYGNCKIHFIAKFIVLSNYHSSFYPFFWCNDHSAVAQ